MRSQRGRVRQWRTNTKIVLKLGIALTFVSVASAGPRFNVSHSFNFSGSGPSDLGIYRSGSFWYFQSSTANLALYSLGNPGDVPLAADYDGDGRTDFAIYRPSTAQFGWVRSSDGVFTTVVAGNFGDIPIVGDFDGDGKTDLAIFRPDTSDFWYTRSSDNVLVRVPTGAAGKLPVVGDFDGDGKDEAAAFDSATGTLQFTRSSDGTQVTLPLGQPGDIPLVGDFDGDGIADPAVYTSGTSTFKYQRSSDGAIVSVQWGQHGDIPMIGDYDGDGKTDVAVFRPGNGTANQFIYLSSVSGQTVAIYFGNPGDTPLGERYAPADMGTGLTYANLPAAPQTFYQSGVPNTDRHGALRTALAADSFLPLCVYGAVQTTFADLKDAGFNCVSPSFNYALGPSLSEASANGVGLQVVPYLQLDKCSMSDSTCGAANKLNTFATEITSVVEDPTLDAALLAWKIEDEPSDCASHSNCVARESNYDALSAKIQSIETSASVDSLIHPIFDLDLPPDAPCSPAPTVVCWQTWNTIDSIAANDGYPFVPSQETTSLSDYAAFYTELRNLTSQNGITRPMWITPQAFAADGAYTMPTPGQLRAQVFTALIHGATGIFYFNMDSYDSRNSGVIGIASATPLCYYVDPNGPGYLTSTDLPVCTAMASGVIATKAEAQASQTLWGQTIALNSELTRLQNVILSPTTTLSYQVGVQGTGTVDTPTPIRTLLKVSSTGVYTMMVVNVDSTALNMQFVLPWRPVDLYSIDAVGGRNPMGANVTTFADSIEGFGVRVYEFK